MSAPADTRTIAGSPLREFLHGLPGVDRVGAEARAAMLASRSIKTTAKQWALDTAISMIDLTTLEGQDTPGKVRALCAKAKRPDPADPTAPMVAAVCVYPDLAHVAAAELKGSGVHVASVAARASAPTRSTPGSPCRKPRSDACDQVTLCVSADALIGDSLLRPLRRGCRVHIALTTWLWHSCT